MATLDVGLDGVDSKVAHVQDEVAVCSTIMPVTPCICMHSVSQFLQPYVAHIDTFFHLANMI